MDKSIWRQCKRKNRYRDEHAANYYRRKFDKSVARNWIITGARIVMGFI